MATTSEIVKKLNLQPHTEGGFYAETLRDTSIVLSSSQLPSEYKVDRAISTSIYFLLPAGNVSLLHRIPCAETWHFYLGEPLTTCARAFNPVNAEIMKTLTHSWSLIFLPSFGERVLRTLQYELEKDEAQLGLTETKCYCFLYIHRSH